MYCRLVSLVAVWAVLLGNTSRELRADELGDRLAKTIEAFAGGGQFQGCVLIARGEEILYQMAFGMADVASGTANTLETPFRIASVTKGITAVLVLQAVEREELGFDAAIRDFLPELSSTPAGEVTVRQLLAHKSGIPDFAPEAHKGETVRQAIVRHLKDVSLDTEPGTEYKYCNVGYTLLGVILEQATGKSFRDLAEERIFRLAGMDRSYVDIGSNEKSVRAVGYESQNGTLARNEVDANLKLLAAAGAIVSNVGDLHRFSQALQTDTLLSEKSLKAMTNPDEPLGCRIMRAPGNGQLQIMQGGMTGAAALLVRSNGGEYTIVILSNLDSAPLQQMAIKLVGALQSAR